ncbi:MAG: hypothetical protein WCQ96_02560 [Patescibacteria group bacterium]
MEKISKTKRKLINYLDRFIDSDEFQNNIKILRKEFCIPKKGFKLSKRKRTKIFKENLLTDLFYIMYIAEESKDNKNEIKFLNDINKSLERVIQADFPYSSSLLFIFKIYLFYNERIYEVLEVGIQSSDLCEVVDVIEDIEDLNAFDFIGVLGLLRRSYEDFPIAIRIHPNVTQRDLIDYIENNWLKINHLLRKYRKEESSLGKLRARDASKKKMYDFIYENRRLPEKKIFRLVSEKFDKELDFGHIGKIISLEKKRRKEV